MSHKTAEDCLEVIGRIEKVLNIQPKKKVAVLRHADADGFGSAYSVWKALKDTCELLFIPVQYGQEPPLAELSNFNPEKVFIVDFSYNCETLTILESAFKDLTVIDHHKTSLAELQKWQPNNSVNPGAGSYFHDETLAGCTLTWSLFHLDPDWNPEEHGTDELHPSSMPPDVLLYVADRDLWKFEMEHSKEINAFIATMDEDFDVWDDFYTPEAYDCGKAILKFQGEQIKRRLKDVVLVSYMTEKGMKPFCKPLGNGMIFAGSVLIPIVNASENQSELGEAMCLAYPDAPFSVSYCDRADGNRSYSLRSRNGFDVSAVCKAFNGGGHPAAGGFTLPAPEII